MNWKKRIVSSLLTLAMVLTIFPSMALAETGTQSGNCGETLTWTLENGVLTIAGTGKMDDYSYWDRNGDGYKEAPWYAFSNDITTVVIQPGVTGIGSSAFTEFSRLTSVSIPDGVTSIGSEAFEGCSSLTEIVLPGSVTSIGESAFYDCSALTCVTIPDGVTSIDAYTFSYCGDLTSITIPASVVSIGYESFHACRNLTDIHYIGTQEQWAKVTIDSGNDKFTAAEIHYEPPKPPEEPPAPAPTSGACGENLTWAVENGVLTITGTGEMSEFAQAAPWDMLAEEIRKVDIQPGVTSIGVGAFSACSGLTEITIPDSVSSIGQSAFDGCSSLTAVQYGGSKAQWAQIKIESGNEIVTESDIHFTEVPEPPITSPFVDVQDKESWYYAPVLWAVSHGITTGMTATQFKPDGSCTRAQAVTFLWRAAGKPEPKAETSPFSDVQDKEAWYYKAVLWAVEQKITTGATSTKFEPEGICTRGHIVTFLWRTAGRPAASGNGFTDVKADAYYNMPVLWAVAKGITNGVSETKFEPDSACTRGHIVTFLARYFAAE